MEYLTSDEKTNLDMLRVLIFDFLSAETAIENARQCNDIGEWVRVVVDGLQPSVKGYTNQQINLALALILYEKSVRTSEYNDIFGRFTEIYQEKGKVY